jgi:hypothetical protein
MLVSVLRLLIVRDAVSPSCQWMFRSPTIGLAQAVDVESRFIAVHQFPHDVGCQYFIPRGIAARSHDTASLLGPLSTAVSIFIELPVGDGHIR